LVDIDILGKALWAYHSHGEEVEISVSSTVSDAEVIPASYFFRNYQKMNILEQLTMDLCRGRVLDLGAGAGCHSLYLQHDGFEVISLEQSAQLCRLMDDQGVKHIVNKRLENFTDAEKFDTIIALMNGIGIAGSLDGLESFLSQLVALLRPGGQIIIDSSDISHMYFDDDGVMHLDLQNGRVGEIVYRLELDDEFSEFPWVFPDFDFLKETCDALALSCERLMDLEESFLVRISPHQPENHASSL
jgi:SAM-dependent methyltransferase